MGLVCFEFAGFGVGFVYVLSWWMECLVIVRRFDTGLGRDFGLRYPEVLVFT